MGVNNHGGEAADARRPAVIARRYSAVAISASYRRDCHAPVRAASTGLPAVRLAKTRGETAEYGLAMTEQGTGCCSEQCCCSICSHASRPGMAILRMAWLRASQHPPSRTAMTP